MSLFVTLKCDEDCLNVVERFGYTDLVYWVERGREVLWDREGDIRDVPNAILRDALREYDMHHPTDSIDPNQHVKRISQELAGWIYWEQTTPIRRAT